MGYISVCECDRCGRREETAGVTIDQWRTVIVRDDNRNPRIEKLFCPPCTESVIQFLYAKVKE